MHQKLSSGVVEFIHSVLTLTVAIDIQPTSCCAIKNLDEVIHFETEVLIFWNGPDFGEGSREERRVDSEAF